MADPKDLSSDQVENVWRAAIDCMMVHDNGYSGDSHSGYTGPMGDWPAVNGPTGDLTLTQPREAHDPHPYSVTVNPWNDYYNPWIEKVESLFAPWQFLPTPSDFHKEALYDAVWYVSASIPGRDDGPKSMNDPLSNDLHVLWKWLSPDSASGMSADTLYTFDSIYGGAAIGGILENLRLGPIALGLALTAERKLWTAARNDVLHLASEAVTAFKSLTSEGAQALEVAIAMTGLLGDFAPDLGIVSDGLGLISSALPKNEEPATPALAENANTADDVFANLTKALNTTLQTKISTHETHIQNMLKAQLADMNDGKKRTSYHVDPSKGLNEKVRDLPTISVRSETIADLGYNKMSEIGAQLAHSSKCCDRGDSEFAWVRSPVIGIGYEGPYQEWLSLKNLTVALLDSNAKEIVEAGRTLGHIAGYFTDVDGDVKRNLKGVQGEINNAGMAWPKPKPTPQADPTPPPPPRHGGPQMTEY